LLAQRQTFFDGVYQLGGGAKTNVGVSKSGYHDGQNPVKAHGINNPIHRIVTGL